jgi:phosphonate transport system substrate-binding protein
MYTPRFVSSHDNVYRNVVLRKADVGGGVTSTFQNQPDQLRNKLKIIYKTDSIISHPLAAHPRVPAKIVKLVTDTMTDYQKNHVALLHNIKLDGPILTNYEEYRFLEQMDLEKYMTQ